MGKGAKQFGALCVEAGFLTEEELRAVIAELGAPSRVALGQALVERGYLTNRQVRETLALQDKELLECPGCAKRYVVKEYKPGQAYKCKGCGHAPLAVVERHQPVDFDAQVGDSAVDVPAVAVPPVGPAAPPPDSFAREDGARIRPSRSDDGSFIREDGSIISAGGSIVAKLDADGKLGADVTLRDADLDRARDLISGSSPEGKYVVDREIGRGGMGQILAVADQDVRRQVAMKLMLGASERKLRRFLQEAQVTGQLEHPNIVPLHEIGVAPDGKVYFTMKLVRGENLGAILREVFTSDAKHAADFPLPRLLEIFIKMCDAVAFAHSKGVVHRDLKPENVMVAGFGEVLVMDWGLAKITGRDDGAAEDLVRTLRSEEGVSLSLDGQVMGTPSYMPPEQADEERVAEVDELSDVYSLGAILYEILCGRPPHTGADSWDIIAQVLKIKIKPPETHLARGPARARKAGNPARGADASTQPRLVPPELSAVAMKALAKKKRARYQSVEDLQSDVRAYLQGRLVSAHRYGRVERAVKWVRLHKTVSLGVSVGAAAAIVLCIGYLWSLNAQSIAAQVGERVAREEQNNALRASAASNLAEARRLLQESEAAYRRVAGAGSKNTILIPLGQDVATVVKAYGGDAKPITETTAVSVPTRVTGLDSYADALGPAELAVIFANRAADEAAGGGLEEAAAAAGDVLDRCRLNAARVANAAGNFQKALEHLAKLQRIPSADSAGAEEALSYAQGKCPLEVTTRPTGATVKVCPLPDERSIPEKAILTGRSPCSWPDVERGSYILLIEKAGFAAVRFHLRLDRELPPEAAHEMAALAGGRVGGFAQALAAERARLVGFAPARRAVHVDLVREGDVPENFVVIPAGSFLFGEELDPRYVETFLAGKYEVTAGEYEQFLNSL
ncbi:MAG: protein kinase, partial [Planctomycetes bacterium]|nr:protein kinase [Planctomycetota bacterium]